MRIWREAGFRVFDVYENVIVEGLPEGGYAMFEYVDAERFVIYFADKKCRWRKSLPCGAGFCRCGIAAMPLPLSGGSRAVIAAT